MAMTVVLETDGGERRLTLDELLGQGAEGSVFSVLELKSLAVKLCPRPGGPPGESRDAARARYQRRVTSMASAVHFGCYVRDGHPAAAWPIGPARTEEAAPVPGFAMVRLRGSSHRRLSDFLEPATRIAAFPETGVRWDHMVAAALNLTGILGYASARGWAILDLAPRNFLVTATGRVTAIDTDSWQWVDPRSAEQFPCWTPSQEWGAPEMREAPKGSLFELSAPLFGLGVMVTQLLLAGNHPFDGVPVGLAPGAPYSVVDAIAAGKSRVLDPSGLSVPPWATPIDVMSPAAVDLAQRCLGAGRMNPAIRPRPQEWAAVLRDTLAGSIACSREVSHRFYRGRSTCPWCELVDGGHADPFPAPVQATGPAGAAGTKMPRSATRRPSTTRQAPAPPAPAPSTIPAPPATPTRPVPSRRTPVLLSSLWWIIPLALVVWMILGAVAQGR